MNHNRFFIILVVLLLSTSSFAQPNWWLGQKKPYKWQLGLSWNAVDDDGRAVCQPFDIKQSWNYPLFPSRLMVDRYLRKGFSIEFAGAYNNYSASKLVNDTTGLSGLFISLDLNTKYSFYQLFYPMKWFEPYVVAGVGMTHRKAYEKTITGNLNIGVGFNFWFHRSWGIQLQTTGKLAITGKFFSTDADYMQHTFGVVFRVPEPKNKGMSTKKQYKWTKSKQKYRGGADGKTKG